MKNGTAEEGPKATAPEACEGRGSFFILQFVHLSRLQCSFNPVIRFFAVRLYCCLVTGSSVLPNVPNPDEMETLPWAGLMVPAAKPPSCLGAVMAGLTVVADQVHMDPTQQYKRNFKQLVDKMKNPTEGAFVCYSVFPQLFPNIQTFPMLYVEL